MILRMISNVRVTVAAVVALAPMFGSSAYAEPKTIEVVIEHFAFVPTSIEVAPGDTVIFVNRDIATHTATARDGSWSTVDIAGGKADKVVVPARGTGDYLCRYHPMMKGRLLITGPH
jgi:plastocyanin